MNHQIWMEHCLVLARQAAELGEVPIAAALVRRAAQQLGNYRLPGCTLYVTVEPCSMCAGALVHARIQRLVFGAEEPRAGAVVSRQQLLDQDWLNHRVEYQGGVLAQASADLMRNFFNQRRTVAGT